MKKQKKKSDTNESLGKLKIIDDFLPVPKNLIFKKEKINHEYNREKENEKRKLHCNNRGCPIASRSV